MKKKIIFLYLGLLLSVVCQAKSIDYNKLENKNGILYELNQTEPFTKVKRTIKME